MREILLTQGQVALVDDRDYDYLKRWKWCAQKANVKGRIAYYAVRATRKIDGEPPKKIIRMHHIIIGFPNPGFETDHKDGDGLNNQRFNIHNVTRRQNGQNTRYIMGNKPSSQYSGVGWHKQAKKWRAYIKIKGKQKYLGLFDSELEAAKAHKNAVEEIGEFMLNKDIIR